MAIVVSCQGCGFRSSRPLPLETPILLSDLPSRTSVSARVASCLPLGSGGKEFLIGVALYNHGNVWGIANPPKDWDAAPATGIGESAAAGAAVGGKQSWPYNLFADGAEAQLVKK